MLPWLVVKGATMAAVLLYRLTPTIRLFRPRDATNAPKMTRLSYLIISGGGEEDDNNEMSALPIQLSKQSSDSSETSGKENDSKESKNNRRASDVIRNYDQDSCISEDSIKLRQKIGDRAKECKEELLLAQMQNESPAHPKKLLHFMAPRIPAIKHSPDYMLRIKSARADLDAGVAACAIAMVARICELSETNSQRKLEYGYKKNRSIDSTSSQVVSDRAFEQLVECVLCGVDVKKRMREADRLEKHALSNEAAVDKGNDKVSTESDVLENATAKVHEGVSIRDACRAAWGIAFLGGNQLEFIGGEKTIDILMALSLRTAELLRSRLQELREDNSPPEEFHEGVEELAHDVASVMWSFGRVKAYTGMRSYHLFDICCSILSQSQDLSQWDKKEDEVFSGISDIVERLAQSEAESDTVEKLVQSEALLLQNLARSEELFDIGSTTLNADVQVTTRDISSIIVNDERIKKTKDILLDSLSQNEVVDALFALASHSSTHDSSVTESRSLPETCAALREVAFDRLVEWIQRDLTLIEGADTQVRAAPNSATISIDNHIGSSKEKGEVEGSLTNNDDLTIATPQATRDEDVQDNGVAGTSVPKRDNGKLNKNGTKSQSVQVVDAGVLLVDQTHEDGCEIQRVQVVDAAAILSGRGLPEASEAKHMQVVDAAALLVGQKIDAEPEIQQVQVVDAATLLAGQSLEKIPKVQQVQVMDASELLVSQTLVEDSEVQQVKVINASTFLDSSSGPSRNIAIGAENESILPSKADQIQKAEDELHEVTVANGGRNYAPGNDDYQDILENADALEHTDCVPDEGALSLDHGLQQGGLEPLVTKPHFSAHELCRIAWSATYLKDPLRFQIVDIISRIFAHSRSPCVSELIGFETLNLAWAISQCTVEGRASITTNEDLESTPALVITRLIAANILMKLGLPNGGNTDKDFNDKVSDTLEHFRPRELSRLIFSLSCIEANHENMSNKNEDERDALSTLATLALYTAKSNITEFPTEDLARISWSFLKLGDSSQSTSRTLVARVLGKVLSGIETSLLRWESGQLLDPTPIDKDETVESKRFASLFRKLYTGVDDDSVTQLSTVSQSGRLPLLRHLTVHPSTLCKLASAFSLSSKDPRGFDGSWTLLRIAVRLLTTKCGHLLKECPVQDIIGLCHACATNHVLGEARDFISHSLAHRVVQLLNDSLFDTKTESASTVPFLSRSKPNEVALLFWSLGEMGVHHTSNDDSPTTAYKRLRLITEKPLMTPIELKSLGPSSLATLLHGLVAMHTTSRDTPFLRNVLSELDSKIGSLSLGCEFCQVALSLVDIRYSHGSCLASDTPLTEKEGNADISPQVDILDQTDKNASESRNSAGKKSTEIQLYDWCTALLLRLADAACKKVSEFTAKEMRILLMSYAIHSLEAHTMIDTIDNEVTKRVSSLRRAGIMSGGASIEHLARTAAEDAVEATNALSAALQEDTSLMLPKNDVDSVGQQLDTLKELLSRAAASACNAAARIERFGRGTKVSADKAMRGLEEGEAFELGRCQELVADYRRSKK